MVHGVELAFHEFIMHPLLAVAILRYLHWLKFDYRMDEGGIRCHESIYILVSENEENIGVSSCF